MTHAYGQQPETDLTDMPEGTEAHVATPTAPQGSTIPPGSKRRQNGGNRPVRHRVGNQAAAQALPDSILLGNDPATPEEVVESEVTSVGDSLRVVPVDTIPVISPEELTLPDSIMMTAGERMEADSLALLAAKKPMEDEWVPRAVEFSPDPTKAVWLSALFPGLGQVYNRRYWKLPIIVGGYLGLAYATDWNNQMLRDYTNAYADLLDNDPGTNSYMDLFPPSTNESSLDKTWLQNLIKSRKNYFRRNRDLCIICMVGVYLLAMVDAYVDASLSHFDISPDLTMDVAPAMIRDSNSRYPSVGLVWALNF